MSKAKRKLLGVSPPKRKAKVAKTVKPIVSSVRSRFWSLASTVKVMRLYFVKEATGHRKFDSPGF